MASSATTRCGRLLSSATARGTLLGSPPPSTSRFPVPFVATFPWGGSCFLGAGLFRLLALEFFFRQACLLRGLLGLRIFIDQFRRRHLQRRIVLKTRFHRLVINRVGIELLVDPLGQTHLPDALNVARPWPVGETVQGMENGFVGGELGDV